MRQPSEEIKPEEKLDVIKKYSDGNMVLECGVAGKVDYIVTGDSDLLKLKEFRA